MLPIILDQSADWACLWMSKHMLLGVDNTLMFTCSTSICSPLLTYTMSNLCAVFSEAPNFLASCGVVLVINLSVAYVASVTACILSAFCMFGVNAIVCFTFACCVCQLIRCIMPVASVCDKAASQVWLYKYCWSDCAQFCNAKSALCCLICVASSLTLRCVAACERYVHPSSGCCIACRMPCEPSCL